MATITLGSPGTAITNHTNNLEIVLIDDNTLSIAFDREQAGSNSYVRVRRRRNSVFDAGRELSGLTSNDGSVGFQLSNLDRLASFEYFGPPSASTHSISLDVDLSEPGTDPPQDGDQYFFEFDRSSSFTGTDYGILVVTYNANPPVDLTVSIEPDSVEAGAESLATVTRAGGDLNTLLVVELASSDEGIATVPASIIIAAGQASGTATIDTVAAGSAVITASHADASTDATAQVTVTDLPPGPVPSDGVVTTRFRALTLSRYDTSTLRVRLFANDVQPTSEITAADLQDASFDGAGELAVTAKHSSALPYAPNVHLDGDMPFLDFEDVEWTNTGTTEETVYGAYVIDTALNLHGQVAGVIRFSSPRVISPDSGLRVSLDWLRKNAV